MDSSPIANFHNCIIVRTYLKIYIILLITFMLLLRKGSHKIVPYLKQTVQFIKGLRSIKGLIAILTNSSKGKIDQILLLKFGLNKMIACWLKRNDSPKT